MAKSVHDLVRDACHAHSDLNIFHACMALMENGLVYTQRGNRTAQRIVAMCKKEASSQLDDYDRASEEIERRAR